MLKEIDPFAFEQTSMADKTKNKELRVVQDPDDRRKLDERWLKVAQEARKNQGYEDPECNYLLTLLVPFGGGELHWKKKGIYATVYNKGINTMI